jgi:hypothetical protein
MFDGNARNVPFTVILVKAMTAITYIYFKGENAVGSMKTDWVFSTIGPFASDAARAVFHSGSLRNSSQFLVAASRFGCERT